MFHQVPSPTSLSVIPNLNLPQNTQNGSIDRFWRKLWVIHCGNKNREFTRLSIEKKNN
jgi:hypothetical protein